MHSRGKGRRRPLRETRRAGPEGVLMGVPAGYAGVSARSTASFRRK
jgi:hypothetical protein